MIYESATTEYHMRMWGSAFNEGSGVTEILGINKQSPCDLWFDSEAEMNDFERKARRAAESRCATIASVKHVGPCAKIQTVAEMVLVDSDGSRYKYRENFGYGYSPDAAEYMFVDGNYSCDCYLSDVIADISGDERRQRDCGDIIRVEDFSVISGEVLDV